MKMYQNDYIATFPKRDLEFSTASTRRYRDIKALPDLELRSLSFLAN